MLDNLISAGADAYSTMGFKPYFDLRSLGIGVNIEIQI